MKLMGVCLDAISGVTEVLPSNISYESSTDNKYRLL